VAGRRFDDVPTPTDACGTQGVASGSAAAPFSVREHAANTRRSVDTPVHARPADHLTACNCRDRSRSTRRSQLQAAMRSVPVVVLDVLGQGPPPGAAGQRSTASPGTRGGHWRPSVRTGHSHLAPAPESGSPPGLASRRELRQEFACEPSSPYAGEPRKPDRWRRIVWAARTGTRITGCTPGVFGRSPRPRPAPPSAPLSFSVKFRRGYSPRPKLYSEPVEG
jgi:hypothetical protein